MSDFLPQLVVAALILLGLSAALAALILSDCEMTGTGVLLGLCLGPVGVVVAALLRIDSTIARHSAPAVERPVTTESGARRGFGSTKNVR